MSPADSSAPPSRLVIRQGDDWHVHLRDGAMLADVLRYTARQFARAIVMPNLSPPAATTGEVAEYRARIMAAPAPVDSVPRPRQSPATSVARRDTSATATSPASAT